MTSDSGRTQFREEQIAMCRAMAAEAERFAAERAKDRNQYLALAAKWSDLAAALEVVLREAKG